jgi:hypothetical protein
LFLRQCHADAHDDPAADWLLAALGLMMRPQSTEPSQRETRAPPVSSAMRAARSTRR